MATQSQQRFGWGALALLVVGFVALVMLVNVLVRGARVDLTESQLYSISDGTDEILNTIDEPINLYFYFSQGAAEDIPFLKTYAQRVRETLEEYEARADGNLNLVVIDPAPFSEAEDEASAYGLQAVPVSAVGDAIYFGLAGTNSIGETASIPFFQPEKEAFLEYDISKLIFELSGAERPVLGVMSTLPVTAGFDPQTRQMREPWVAIEQLEQLFEVRTVPPSAVSIDDEISLLLVIHPKELTPASAYALDQFALSGGRVLAFVDPLAEVDQAAADPNNPTAALMANRSSDLPELFAAWGIGFDVNQVVTDSQAAMQVAMNPGQPPVRHLGILSYGPDALNVDDVVTSQLSSINFSTAGALTPLESVGTTFEPLVQSSESSMLMDAERFKFLGDPNSLRNNFEPSGARFALAARVTGEINSAFPDGPPADVEADGEHLSASAEQLNVIVVADADMLADRLWVRKQSFFGQTLLSAFANNGDLVTNAVDNLGGSGALISIRGRETANRPFTTVEALQRDAEAAFLATEQSLQAELAETEQRLSELQQGRAEGDDMMIMTPEQQAELERFNAEKLRIRKELRQVRRQLDEDIESLGATLKVINIALMPVLVTLFALGVAYWRRKRRQSQREQGDQA